MKLLHTFYAKTSASLFKLHTEHLELTAAVAERIAAAFGASVAEVTEWLTAGTAVHAGVSMWCKG